MPLSSARAPRGEGASAAASAASAQTRARGLRYGGFVSARGKGCLRVEQFRALGAFEGCSGEDAPTTMLIGEGAHAAEPIRRGCLAAGAQLLPGWHFTRLLLVSPRAGRVRCAARPGDGDAADAALIGCIATGASVSLAGIARRRSLTNPKSWGQTQRFRRALLFGAPRTLRRAAPWLSGSARVSVCHACRAEGVLRARHGWAIYSKNKQTCSFTLAGTTLAPGTHRSSRRAASCVVWDPSTGFGIELVAVAVGEGLARYVRGARGAERDARARVSTLAAWRTSQGLGLGQVTSVIGDKAKVVRIYSPTRWTRYQDPAKASMKHFEK